MHQVQVTISIPSDAKLSNVDSLLADLEDGVNNILALPVEYDGMKLAGCAYVGSDN